MNRDPILLEAIQALGGPSKLARALGISRVAVNQWKRAPYQRAIQIDELSQGRFPRSRLRPDIWPPNDPVELAESGKGGP